MLVTTTNLAEHGRADTQIVRSQPSGTLPDASMVTYLSQGAVTLPQPFPHVVRLRWVIDKQGLRMQWSQHLARLG